MEIQFVSIQQSMAAGNLIMKSGLRDSLGE